MAGDSRSSSSSGVMAGGGFYEHNSATQQGAAARGIELLREAAAEVTPGGHGWRVVDLGCAPGHISLEGMAVAIDARCEQARRAVLASNDITADEYAAMVYPTWFRTLNELRAPVDPAFVGSGGASLELVALEPATLDDPFLDAYRSTGDAQAYGRSQAGFLRGFLEPSFRAALAARPDANQQAVLDAIFDDTATRISADPDAVSPTYRLVTGRLRRTS